jgi:methylenetetrahydrofolate reductase (NADPH)
MTIEPGRAGGLSDSQPAVESMRGHSRIEVIPLPSLSRGMEGLPASRLSVTCSPTHGVDVTVDVTCRLRELGHDAIPHLAARQVESRAHVAALAARCDAAGVTEVFFVGGDAAQPVGSYDRAIDLAADYASSSHAIEGYGFTAYPDGHAAISAELLSAALHEKQAFVSAVGAYGYVSTQMCFSAPAIAGWARRERACGLTLPIRLGVPGRVDRLKLASISGRLGVASSLRFIKKNRASVTKLMTRAHFEPTEIVDEVLGEEPGLGIAGLHVFSFNNVAASVDWLDGYVGESRAGQGVEESVASAKSI